jgi:hypothetical protein
MTMRITSGSYQYYEDGVRRCTYIVFGVGEHTETGAWYVLAQKSGLLDPPFLIFEREKFAAAVRDAPAQLGISYVLVLERRPEVMTRMNPDHTQKAGLWRHFKDAGHVYNRLGIATDPETSREYVLYQPLYGEHRYKFCLRPIAMWSEHVDRPEYGYSGPRFIMIDGPYRDPHIATNWQD